MPENMCAGAHPAWVELHSILDAPGILRGRQRSRAFISSIKAVAKLVITYHGIRRGGGGDHVFTLPRTAMARIVGLSDSAVYRVLAILEDVGLIRRVGKLRRRCHSGTTSPNPGITGVCFEPLTYVVGSRFRGFFDERSGTELAVSPAENHSEQEKLPTLTESRTDSTVLDSDRDSKDSLSASLFLSALTGAIQKRAVITRVDYDRRPPLKPKLPRGYDPVAAELELLRQQQARTKAENDQRSRQGRAWSRFWPGGSRLR